MRAAWIIFGRRRTRTLQLLVTAIALTVFLNFRIFWVVSNQADKALTVEVHLEDQPSYRMPPRNSTFLVDSENSFSACMIIKDDNEILNEWLGYHYHALNLRYILVAVDPSSETSPHEIFEKWRKLTDLQIEEWTDLDYMPDIFLRKGYHIPPRYISGDANQSKWHEGYEDPEQVIQDKIKIGNHRFRQKTFLASCFRHMKRRNRKLVFHIDTDEYITINPVLRGNEKTKLKIPSIAEPGSILSVLQQIHQDTKLRKAANYPCISMPRLLFGSVERPEEGPPSAPHGFNATLLETLRWKYHAAYNDTERNAQPKVIVDVSVVDKKDELIGSKQVFSIHRPSKEMCRRIEQLSFRAINRYPLTVNHYLGTWERYVGRNDTRRSFRTYEYKAHVQAGRDDWISSWLGGFVQSYGRHLAMELLDDYTIQ